MSFVESVEFEGGDFVFYDRFIELCNKKGVKPTPLVVELGLSSSNASQWKKGSTPRPDILQKIADYFDVTVGYLVGSEENEKPALLTESELDSDLINKLVQLSPEEQEKVDAFVQGLIASR